MTAEISPPRINVMEFDGKDHLLKVLRAERVAFFEMVDALNDEEWQAPTPCSEWQVRDLVGHMVDVSEAYLDRFALARDGKPFPEPLGLRVMANSLDQGAKRFRSVPRAELIARLRKAAAVLADIFDRLDAQQWTGEMIPHVYMGPIPAFFYPAFQLIDYSVHSWDALQGLGRPAPLTPSAAGTLVPFMLILLQSTLDAERAQGVACACGIRVAGDFGGTWRVRVGDGALTYEEGSIEDCAAVFDFDTNEFVLTTYQRIRGGRASGDQQVAERFRGLFFNI